MILLRAFLTVGVLLASVLASVLAPVLASPVPATADTGPTTPLSQPARTKIVLRVSDCDGCTVRPFNFRTQTSLGGEKIVADGRVVYRMRTAATRGLGIYVISPDSELGAENLAVVRYKGKQPGDRVSVKSSAKAKRATQCWAGTKQARVTLRMRVHHFTVRYPGAPSEKAIRPYFAPTLRSLGKPWRTQKGMLAIQAPVDCSGKYPF